MQTRRRLILILIGVGVLVGVLALVFRPAPEPEYGGKKLSEWIKKCGEKNYPEASLTRFISYELPELDHEADDAVLHLGTNAIPYLLDWISYEGWKKEPKSIRAYGAVGGFRSLGPTANTATNELTRMLNDPKATFAHWKAAQCLACLGPAGLAPLLAALTNQQAGIVRQWAAESIAGMGTNARPALPVLIGCLQDNDKNFVRAVVGALGASKLERALVVPAFVKLLQGDGDVRVLVALELRGFGEEARPAVPALLKLLNDPNSNVRSIATNALKRIDPEVPGKVMDR